MKNHLTVLMLAIVLVAVMAVAGIDGMIRGTSFGPFFLFVAVCTAAGLSLDLTKFIKERLRQSHIRKFGR